MDTAAARVSPRMPKSRKPKRRDNIVKQKKIKPQGRWDECLTIFSRVPLLPEDG